MKRILSLIIISLIFTTGCWDMVEIDRRVYPYSFGLDLNTDGDKNRYVLSMTYPNINAIGKNAMQEERVYNLTTEGDSIFGGSKSFSNKLAFPYYDKHLRVLLLGCELAEDEQVVREVLDSILRDFIINKKIRLAVVDGKPSEILDRIQEYKRQEAVEGTLFNLLSNRQNSTSFTTQSLTNFTCETDYSGCSLMPLIRSEGNDLVASGGAIFKDYKLTGFIDEKENMAITILKGMVKEDVIDFDYNGIIISYDIAYIKSKMKLIEAGDNIKIQIQVRTRGNIQEYILEDNSTLASKEGILGIEKAIEKDMKKELDKVVEKLQRYYKADLIEIARYLRSYHPKLWEQVEDDWETIYPEIQIEVIPEVKIIRKGLIK